MSERLLPPFTNKDKTLKTTERRHTKSTHTHTHTRTSPTHLGSLPRLLLLLLLLPLCRRLGLGLLRRQLGPLGRGRTHLRLLLLHTSRRGTQNHKRSPPPSQIKTRHTKQREMTHQTKHTHPPHTSAAFLAFSSSCFFFLSAAAAALASFAVSCVALGVAALTSVSFSFSFSFSASLPLSASASCSPSACG